jgi:membrane-anchored protein YejM (alkaline phosphatase superfamily)
MHVDMIILKKFIEIIYQLVSLKRYYLQHRIRILGLPPLDPMDAALRVAGQDGLKQAYKENLREVLKCINLLLQTISGKIIIIADHGELLGEGGDYSHRMGYHVPLLIEVPKLELNIKQESKARRIISKNIQKLKSEDKI